MSAACADDNANEATTSTTGATADTEELFGTPDPATGTPVKVGVISDGATQTFDNSADFDAAQAAVDYWNEYHGGIAGHEVETVTCETKGEPSAAGDCANKMISEGVVAVVLGQSAVAGDVWKPLHEAKVPVMVLTASEEPVTDPDSTFVLHSSTGNLFALPIAVAKEEDVDKVAFVVIDVPQALELFETVAPDLLEEAGIDYELMKVPPGTADMTPQMQQVVDSGASIVQVVGNDSFCIAAFQGLEAVGYAGDITSITQCVTDATREALDPSVLEGMALTSTAAVGATDDEGYQDYVAIMEEYAPGTEPNSSTTMGAYVSAMSFLTALDGLEGDVTTETVTSTIKAMDETSMPGGGGLEYKCDGSADAANPAVCTSQVLKVELDAEGNPAEYTAIDPTG